MTFMSLKQTSLLVASTFFLLLGLVQCQAINYRTTPIPAATAEQKAAIKSVYQTAQLKAYLPFETFSQAMLGWYHIPHQNSDWLIVIDFSQPSNKKRCFVVNVKEKKLAFRCLVAHGKNSGSKQASKFSNTPNSKQSSLGFYLTAETYQGKHGYSLRLDGLEPKFNSKARERAIVIHSADYVSADFVKKNGQLGRSWGCPTLPTNLSKSIIDTIRNGAVLFIYANDKQYEQQSNYLSKTS